MTFFVNPADLVDGETYSTLLTEYNVEISLPSAPTKDNHTFDGWFFEDGTKLYKTTLVGNPLTGDVTVTARFTEILKPEITPDTDAPNYGDQMPGMDDVDAPSDGDFDEWYPVN